MESGFLLDDTKSHNEAVMSLIGSTMGVENLKPLDEEEYPELPVEDKKSSGGDAKGSTSFGGDDFGDGVEGFDQEKLQKMMEEMNAKAKADGGADGAGDVKDEL